MKQFIWILLFVFLGLFPGKALTCSVCDRLFDAYGDELQSLVNVMVSAPWLSDFLKQPNSYCVCGYGEIGEGIQLRRKDELIAYITYEYLPLNIIFGYALGIGRPEDNKIPTWMGFTTGKLYCRGFMAHSVMGSVCFLCNTPARFSAQNKMHF